MTWRRPDDESLFEPKMVSLLTHICFTQPKWVNRQIHISEIMSHDDVMKCKHVPRYWPFLRGIHRSPVNSPQNGQWRGTLVLSLICPWTNVWVNNRDAGDLRGHGANNDVIAMWRSHLCSLCRHSNRRARPLQQLVSTRLIKLSVVTTCLQLYVSP